MQRECQVLGFSFVGARSEVRGFVCVGNDGSPLSVVGGVTCKISEAAVAALPRPPPSPTPPWDAAYIEINATRTLSILRSFLQNARASAAATHHHRKSRPPLSTFLLSSRTLELAASATAAAAAKAAAAADAAAQREHEVQHRAALDVVVLGLLLVVHLLAGEDEPAA